MKGDVTDRILLFLYPSVLFGVMRTIENGLIVFLWFINLFLKVSLGGVQPLNKEEWGDDACSLSRSFLNSENSSLDMIILGREPSGRLSVDILKNREHSLKDLLIQTKHGQLTPIQNCSIDCSFRKYELKESFYAKDCITSNSVNPIDMLPLTASRQKYSENSTPMESYRCTVSYVESPNSFFVSPLENQEV